MGADTYRLASNRRPRAWLRVAALILALGLAVGAPAASASVNAKATLASAGGGTFVLTVTNTGTSTFGVFAAVPSGGSISHVVPSPACQNQGSFFRCNITVTPGSSARACFRDPAITSFDFTLVTVGQGAAKRTVGTKSAPAVSGCPVHGGKPPAVKCVVPNVKGMALAAAETAIKFFHCRVGTITSKHSSHVAKGHVISQNPAPGKKLPKNSKVDLVKSSGR